MTEGRECLPKSVQPVHYALHMTPNLNACTFDAKVVIDVKVVEECSSIVVNALDLKVKQDCFAAEHDVDCVTVLCWGSGADDEPGFLNIGGEDSKPKLGKPLNFWWSYFK